MTYTILGFCEATGRLGVGIATYSLGVGGKCPQVRSSLGAVSSQAFSNPRLARLGLNLMSAGYGVEAALAEALRSDPFADYRQLGLLDRNGVAAAHTGSKTRPWHGHRTGQGYAVFGNVLTGEAVLAAMEDTFLASKGANLAERLVRAIEAGRDAGGQTGGTGHLPERSAALLVHHRDDHPELDLRVDFHDHAVEELRRIHDEYSLYLPLYRMRAENPPSAPPQEVYVAQLEAERARKEVAK
ncbi:DUF1028 domain-containing protein [Sabulicella rubraurantiaca]|uniref:DUF1028 domain-containing protein n=1 Tax=Sabulicella rubraurantiaca TaxID=2811429 RepID=UPI001A962C73|nr:DUF1028 domain-containing protein [Sabulicella rubraurantiaca]